MVKKTWVCEQWCIRFDRRKKKKMGVKTNNGLEFGKKKDGFVSNSVLDLIGERKKDGVKTNNGLEFGKKTWV